MAVDEDSAWLSQVRFQDIYWRLSLPPNVLGALDWISGVILFNLDLETFDRIRREGAAVDEPWESETTRTLTHEVTHYFQVLLTGYLYNHVAQLTAFVRQCVAESNTEPFTEFSDIVRLIDDLPAKVSSASVRPLMLLDAELHQVGRHGLSVLAIVEAHATYVELRRDYQCNSLGFLELLEVHGVPADYRLAYDVARRQLGEEPAFQLFSLICFLALCSADPVLSFARLLDELARRTPEEGATLDLWTGDLVDTCCGYLYLGSPLDTPPAGTSFYEPALAALRAATTAPDSDFDLHRFFYDPLSGFDDLIQVAYPTIALDPEPTGGIPFQQGLPDDPKHHATMQALIQAVAYRRLVEAVDPATVQPVGEQDTRAARELYLDAARRGSVEGAFNLGILAMRQGHPFVARVWWRLAATDGDAASMKALAIAHSEAGDEETAAYWFERAATAQPVGIAWPALVAMGETVADSDLDAADECFRRAARQDSVRGAWLYGRRAVERDPVEGLYYLAMAAGAGPEHPESLEAHRLIQRLQAGWGTRRTREYVARATERMHADVYGEAPPRRAPTAVVAALVVAVTLATVVVGVVVNAYVAAVLAVFALAGGIAVRRWFVRAGGG